MINLATYTPCCLRTAYRRLSAGSIRPPCYLWSEPCSVGAVWDCLHLQTETTTSRFLRTMPRTTVLGDCMWEEGECNLNSQKVMAPMLPAIMKALGGAQVCALLNLVSAMACKRVLALVARGVDVLRGPHQCDAHRCNHTIGTPLCEFSIDATHTTERA